MSNNSLFQGCNSWSDFQSKLVDLNNKEKGNAFELLTKLYFKINPIYEQYDEVWLFDDVPSKELEYLDLPSQDLGIDLIAKQGDEYHAIQCKYHSDKTVNVTSGEVSTFGWLLEGNDKITQGYICSSADITSRHFKKYENKKINLIMSDSWQLLDEEFFNDVRKILEGKKVTLTPFQPRPHQEKALKESKNYFIKEDNSRGKLIFPCGAGKSLTGFWMTQELKSKSTIIAVPSLSLVKQTLEVYLREIVAKNKRIKWLCICSDEGIGKNDDVAIFTENLGVPCQTDPTYIEQWLKDNIDEEKIIFTTYQSGRIIAEISKKLNFTFDVGIFDEAHKTVGSNKKLFSHLLFEENISIEKRIFMTATERFYAGSKDDIISMDDEDIYGDTFAKMSFKEAIEIGLLTDYKVITIDIKKSEIAEFIRDNNLVQLSDKWKKETEARSLASMLALRKAMKQFNIKNAVSFHSSIEKAVRNKELQKHITETYNYAPIDTYTVSGKQSTSKRNDIVQEFANSPKALITNARCLTEGVDVPNIDCIVFADPRKSRVDIVQALGRALRKKEGKDWGYVILPVIYDEETQEIDNDSFDAILDVVRGLASNDERIIDYFKDINQEKGTKKNKSNDQFNFDVFSDYIDESILSEQLQIKLWDKLAKQEWETFDNAKEFARSLNLKNAVEWFDFCKNGKKPFNIPFSPDKFYESNGWVNWADWLGTEYISTKKRIFKSYNNAKKYIRLQKIKTQKEWGEFKKSGSKPKDIPSSPASYYKNKGWVDWADWLGNSANKKIQYRKFNEAKKYVHRLNIKSQKEWRKVYVKSVDKPKDIPSSPETYYKDQGWQGYGDWLGNGNVYKKKYRQFKEARKYVQSLKLKNKEDWNEFCKSENRPVDIPSHPHSVYIEWKNFGDWIGTQTIATYNREYLDYNSAKKIIQSLKLKNQKEWEGYCNSGDKPNNIPRDPRGVYKDTFKGLGDWLGTGNKSNLNKGFYSFEKARNYIREMNLQSTTSWKEFIHSKERPEFIPTNPNISYKNKGWTNWSDFLGAEKKDKYCSFEDAKKFAKINQVNSGVEWRELFRIGQLPKNIPTIPSRIYKDKWKGWADFLGKEK